MLNAPKSIDLNSNLAIKLGYDTMPGDMEPDMFGVEIELEGRKLKSQQDKVTKWWTNHVDNSLRANKPGSEHTEYVFRKPFNLKDTHTALKALFEYLHNNPGTEVFPSYRTSIHVHVNCLLETIRTVCNYITLCIIFDELLVSQNGEHRIGNNFCLRSKDAEGQVHDLAMSVGQYGSITNISQQHRYSSINFASLLKFGTVEFRSLECTTDLQRLLDWIDLLQGLKVAARQYQDPKEIIAKFSRRGPLGFMVSHLGDHAMKYASVPGAHQMLQNGMRLAQDFAYCSDWKHSDVIVKPRKRTKYEELAQPHQWGQPQHVDVQVYQQMLNAVQAQQAAHGVPIPMPPPVNFADVALDVQAAQAEVDEDEGHEWGEGILDDILDDDD